MNEEKEEEETIEMSEIVDGVLAVVNEDIAEELKRKILKKILKSLKRKFICYSDCLNNNTVDIHNE